MLMMIILITAIFFDYTVDYDNLLIYSDFYNKFEEPIESDLSDIDYFFRVF
jgi:hypothetical protein